MKRVVDFDCYDEEADEGDFGERMSLELVGG